MVIAEQQFTHLPDASPEGEIVFTLTDNNLREGGRPRNPLEVYMNVDSERAAFLGADAVEHFSCITDDGEAFDATARGTHFKNFRSRPIVALGNWLLLRCRAMPGDEVRARWELDQLRLRYVRKYAAPETHTAEQRRLEREIEEGFAAELARNGVAYQRQVRVPSGVIDILTPAAIYEVKTFLTRDDILKGVGQLLIYRADAEGGDVLGLVLVGRETRETAALLPVLAKLGIEVEPWRA
ncbi:MAG TPA: hypothetical protein VNM48_07590 [Chloroflexota bacterium]|nr:hypothetical protein [Chloroflexota bacterium]